MVKHSDPPPSYSEPPPYSRFGESDNERTALLGRIRTQRYTRRYYQDTLDNQRIHLHQSSQRWDRKRRNPWWRIFVVVGSAFLTACVLLGLWFGAQKPLRRPARIVRIAVVGAGPAGIGAAWSLRKEMEGNRRVKVEVTVFERKERVGGRMVMEFNGTGTEDGTILLGARHMGMQDLATGPLLGESSVLRARVESESGLHLKGHDEATSTSTKREAGFFSLSEKEIVAKMPRPVTEMSWGEWWSLVCRYGPSVWKAKKLPSGPERFLALTGTFSSIAAMVKSAALFDTVARSGVQHVKNVGVGDKYQHEILAPQLRRQLGQEIQEVSELAFATSLWSEGQAWPGAGALHLMEEALELLLQSTGAKLQLGTEVLGWKRRRSEAGFGEDKWDLKFKTKGQEVAYEDFDHIVVAAPLNPPLRELLGVEEEVLSYREAWTTFVLVEGGLNSSVFGGTGGLNEILLIPNAASTSSLDSIQAISHIRDLYGPDHASAPSTSNLTAEAIHSLYRIASSQLLSKSTLAEIFGTSAISEAHEQHIEQAWPLLWPRTVDGLEELRTFRVHQGVEGDGDRLGLWWTGGYEGVVSGVEEAWVVGENLGRLVAGCVRTEA